MLRAAREKQGLHIAALAAAIKVAPRKLDALENDRWHELPDATFARALAQTVCRTLKIDAGPILQRLPRPDAATLEQVGGTLNTPFQDGVVREDSVLSRLSLGPMVAGSAVLMLAALLLYFLPLPWSAPEQIAQPQPVVLAPAPEPISAAVAASEALAPPVAAGVAASAEPEAPGADGTGTAPPPAPPEPAAAPVQPGVLAGSAATAPAPVPPAAAGADAPPGLLRLRASAVSWVEVRDADDRLLLSRELQPGDVADVNGRVPLRVVVGNAGGTEMLLRGQPLDLLPLARNNVVRTTLR